MIENGLLYSLNAPLEQVYLSYKVGWLVRRRLGIPVTLVSLYTILRVGVSNT